MGGFVRRRRRDLGILWHYARIGVIRKSQFRVEFWGQVVMDALWYTVHILVFEVLFRHAPSIAGWTRADIRLFLGFLFVSDAFMMMWLGQAWHFGKDLKDGNLDPVRVRPASPVLLYYFRAFSLEACFNMAIAGSYLGYALAQAGARVTPGFAVMLPWALAITWWAQIVLRVLFSIFEFYIVNSDLGQFFRDFFMAVEDRPLDIFARRARAFLLYVLPVGAVAQIPASMVLGRVGAGRALVFTLWMALSGWMVLWFWKASFRRYESAMS